MRGTWWVSCAIVALAAGPARAEEEAPQAGASEPEIVKDPATGIELVLVKGGCFEMGNVFGGGGPEERPAHEVCVDDFLIGRHEVTQAQWTKVMGKNPSAHRECGKECPVEMVSFGDVQAFLGKVNGKGKKASPGYRLPTEAEWEYAARSGGQKEKYAGESDDVARVGWLFWNARERTHPVGELAPNGLGLYDMTGNVWEWTADWYGSTYYASSPKKNPTGPRTGDRRVVRGGSFGVVAFDARASYRNFLPPGHRSMGVGFRVARPVPAAGASPAGKPAAGKGKTP